MRRKHAPTSAATGPPISVFERRGVEGICWVLAIVLLALYCGARSHGQIAVRDTLAMFIHSPSP